MSVHAFLRVLSKLPIFDGAIGFLDYVRFKKQIHSYMGYRDTTVGRVWFKPKKGVKQK